MGITMLVGALLGICGIVLLAVGTINWGKLSDSHVDPVSGHTLEPLRRDVGFFASGRNWPGLFLLGIGTVILLMGALVYPH
jgi:hypothetical protein